MKPNVSIPCLAALAALLALPPFASATGRFTVSGQTVRDNITGRLWQRSALTAPAKNAAQAASYCAALSLDGITGWRLPTVNELASLVDFDSPTGIDAVAFPDAVAGFTAWTSNLVHPAATSGLGYRVQFWGGPHQYMPVVVKDSTFAANGVRCVK